MCLLAFCYNCIDFCWESFYSIIVYAVSLFAPAKRSSNNYYKSSRDGVGKLYKSYPKHLRKLSNKKAKFWRRYKARPTLRKKTTCKKNALLYVKELKRHITSIENTLIDSKNCRSF